jgi:raffinose/stachyose/melibiose transport system permease protein
MRSAQGTIKKPSVPSFNRLGARLTPWVFLSVPLIFYTIFFLIPFVQAGTMSLTDWNGLRQTRNFIGLANYARMFADPLVRVAFKHNLIWIVVGTAAPIIISLFLAMLLWPSTRGANLFQGAYFMPQILSTVVVAAIWAKVYHPLIGVLNKVLELVGLGHLATGWLGSMQWALPAVLIAAVWSYFGFALVVILAGLQTVDVDLVDAASIDGANSLQRFWNVILPQLGPVLTMITAYTLIGGFNVFDIVWVMTAGGPANATDVLSTVLYKRAFVEDHVAYGTSLALMLTALSLIASGIFIYFREKGD